MMKNPRFVNLVILVMGYRKFCLDESREGLKFQTLCVRHSHYVPKKMSRYLK